MGPSLLASLGSSWGAAHRQGVGRPCSLSLISLSILPAGVLIPVTMLMAVVFPEWPCSLGNHQAGGETLRSDKSVPCNLTEGTGIVHQETIMTEEASSQLFERGMVGIKLPRFKVQSQSLPAG